MKKIIIAILLLPIVSAFICRASKNPLNYGSIKLTSTTPKDTVDWPRLFPPPDTSMRIKWHIEGKVVEHFWYFVAYDSQFGEVLNIDGNGKLNILKDSLTAIQIMLKNYIYLSDLFKERPKDTVYIYQEIFRAGVEYALLTNDGSIYDNVVFGSLDYVTKQKEVEYQKALARRKPIAVVTAKCQL